MAHLLPQNTIIEVVGNVGTGKTTLSKKLAKKLGITIDMTSRLNHGSTFGFTMPQAGKK